MGGPPRASGRHWYYEETKDDKGNTSRTYHRFSVVLAELDARLPAVCVQRETVGTRLADHLGFRDVEFESEEFNRRFQVHADDRQFAFKLLDARMISFLVSTGGSYGFEVNGRHLLVWAGRLPPDRLVPLFMATASFVQRVPRMVWEEYGPAGSTP